MFKPLWFAKALWGCLLLLGLGFGQAPTVLVDGISMRKVLDLGGGYIRLAQDPTNDDLYILKSDEGLFRFSLDTNFLIEILPVTTVGGSRLEPTGMTFDALGNIYIVFNQTVDETMNQATVRRGSPNAEGTFDWHTVAVTEPYPLSKTIFNHNYNGIAVSPDGDWLYVNAGSRTDHGEVQDFDGLFPNLREAPLTSKIMRISANAKDLVLPNDEAALIAEGFIFAWGVRNAYDLAFAPNGDLFGIDNGPDADYPEELNWLREGHHYGFPWKFGDWDNQQQFADYDSEADNLQHPDFTAVREGYYQNDPDFPPPPTEFTQPVANKGPDAAYYRALDGSERNAVEEGEILYTFTPHRSPLGLTFVNNTDMPSQWQSTETTHSAFVLSWGSAGGTLSDRGRDLLHLSLSQTEDNYETTTRQIVTDFINPIDSLLIGNKLYVLEWGDQGALWELSFEE